MTREDIIRMAREAGWLHEHDSTTGFVSEAAFKFAALVAAHEREECAKWADLVAREIDNTNNTSSYIASGIRARGEK